jgi:hypothetical protein
MSRRWVGFLLIGVGIALFIALFSPFASSHPDGLESVAEEHGFIDQGQGPSYEIIPDYQFPGVEDERLATILAGISGIVIVTVIALGAGILLSAVARSRAADDGQTSAGPRNSRA